MVFCVVVMVMLYNLYSLAGLVTGFVHLPSYMQAESTEVLWELLLFGREVCIILLICKWEFHWYVIIPF